jgi:hypothetical protein
MAAGRGVLTKSDRQGQVNRTMHNPSRRSRKIGITQGGRVRDGRASEKWSRLFTRDVWQKLSTPQPGQGCRLLVENPSGASYHPCEAEAYLSVLQRLPAEVSRCVRAIVLRRTPKPDERLGVEARMRFGCVIINAFPRSNQMTWSSPPTQAARRHYGRWCSGWAEEGGRVRLDWSLEEVRRYYLFHLFLHEVGHIHQPLFHRARRREEFAENFALEWATKLNELPPKHEDSRGGEHVPMNPPDRLG